MVPFALCGDAVACEHLLASETSADVKDHVKGIIHHPGCGVLQARVVFGDSPCVQGSVEGSCQAPQTQGET